MICALKQTLVLPPESFIPRNPIPMRMVRTAQGCRLCERGAKLVLFVSGECNRRCFYCPLSEKKKGRDVIYANERPVSRDDEIIEEAERMRALGTGITGGEPLMFMERTTHLMRLLKKEFGESHHIHLYTTVAIGKREAEELHSAGLDEIRFHIIGSAGGYSKSVEFSKATGMSTGVELPAIPGDERRISDAVSLGIDFLNLNELEFSETNYAALAAEGFMPVELGCAVLGSEETARRHFLKEDIRAHYCPSRFKDAVQLRERLLRRARRNARPFDCISQEGTIIHGTIDGDAALVLPILEDLGVPEQMYCLRKGGIDIAAAILEDIAKELKEIDCDLCLVERYPLPDGIVVERIHL